MINATRSTRNLSAPATGYAAIYRPMAEGVAQVFARDPGIVRAGLGAEEFTRLFVALIDQESRFNPGAVSPKGARGLGQLMPETAAALGVRDALEPMENLRGAARYLTTQIAAFGRVDLALAAYNAGPHRVTQYQGIPPFRETRDYVARITQAAALEPPPEAIAPPEAPRAPVTPRVPALELVSDAAPLSNPTPPKESVLEWKTDSDRPPS